MSDYPPQQPYYPGYGARDPNSSSYLPQYTNPYAQPDDRRTGQAEIQTHVTPNYEAFGYNRAMPAFSAAPVATSRPLSVLQGWNQDSIPLPPYTVPQYSSQLPGYAHGPNQSAQYYPHSNQTYTPSALGSIPVDQGELSEGEFEDGPVNTTTLPIIKNVSSFAHDNTNGYMGNPQILRNSNVQDSSLQQFSYPARVFDHSARETSKTRRQNSDSYSPYVSHNEDNDQHSTVNQHHNSHVSKSTKASIDYNSKQEPGKTNTKLVEKLNSTPGASGYYRRKSMAESNESHSATPKVQIESAGVTSARSVADSKKRAQAAILNLWPYEVRFQTYIDEGFKADIVGRLFDDLKMSRTAAKILTGVENGTDRQKSKPWRVSGQQETVKSNTAVLGDSLNKPGNTQDGQVLRTSLVSDEKISDSVRVSNISTNAVSEQPAELNDKERTIQAKMDALRKSREERAQKAAAQKGAKAVDPVPVIQPDPPKSAEPKEGLKLPAKPPVSAPPAIAPSVASPTKTPASRLNVQQTTSIPGLFLASSTSSTAPTVPPAPAHSAVDNTPPGKTRKRPVAADFDDSLPMIIPVKRPFGHSRNEQPFVIDVSEDEQDDESDVEMEIESQIGSPDQPARHLSEIKPPTTQTLSSLSNFTRKISASSSTANTPPISQPTPKSALGRPEDLLRKESEIEMLKKKIAEAEARRKGRQTSSGSRTPLIEGNTALENNTAIDSNATSNLEASIAMERLIGIRDNQINSGKQKLAEAQAAELEKAAELQRNEVERIRLRRQRIATDLPLIESEYLQNNARLEQMRAEMATIEATVQKNLEEKLKLADEMARLGQETEDQLQAQKDKLRDLTIDDLESSSGPSIPSSIKPNGHLPNSSASNMDNLEPTRATSLGPNHAENIPVNEDLESSRITRSPSSNSFVPPMMTNGEEKLDMTEFSHKPSEADANNDSINGASVDHALESALQEAVRGEAESRAHEDTNMGTPNSRTPEPTHLGSEPPEIPVEQQSETPNYSPLLHPSSDFSEPEEDYEPPEATPSAQVIVDSPSFTPPPTESKIQNEPMSAHEVSNTNPEKLPQPNGSAPILLVPQASSIDRFTPYESPLKQFRAYRFHPDINNLAASGLRSLTYCHKIDPNAEFCRFELAGGICNDPECELQHFRNIGLQDDAILTLLGSPEEFKGERRDKFCDGLKKVLLDLRLRKVRDFEVIASEILAHRANFLGDSSRVLPLDGVTL